ncbi:MAG: YitT family protein [Erysipelotrichaceae bacterium]|jgi:uncharacterized membrane-anchored protein YitT (DUF2179 family)|nr:YitT family protein [Erysipelotrichaceae bacterium]
MILNKREIFMEYMYVVVGNLVLAAGVGLFILPNHILSGGVAGIAVALEPLLHIDPNTLINVLTLLLFFAGSLVLGKRFALKTFLSSVLYPTFLTIISQFAEAVYITEDPILSSLYGGIMVGLGVGLVFRTGASTGGMDIPPLIINKYTGIALPTLVLITDGLTVVLGALVYGVEAALIGIISVWVSSYMINKAITFGGHDAKNVMIISEKYPEIMDQITKSMNRGATLLEAVGGYTGNRRPVLMIVIVKKQFAELNRIVSHIDPSAFMIVTDAREVQGEGFTYEEEI